MNLPFVVGADRTRVHAGLLAGDVAVVVLLLSLGMIRHNQNPLGVPGRTVLVVGPFVLAWLVVAYALGAYALETRRSVAAAAANAAGTWVVAALLGAGLRATPFLPGNAPPTFVAVVAGFGAVALAAWRGAVTYLVGPVGR